MSREAIIAKCWCTVNQAFVVVGIECCRPNNEAHHCQAGRKWFNRIAHIAFGCTFIDRDSKSPHCVTVSKIHSFKKEQKKKTRIPSFALQLHYASSNAGLSRKKKTTHIVTHDPLLSHINFSFPVSSRHFRSFVQFTGLGTLIFPPLIYVSVPLGLTRSRIWLTGSIHILVFARGSPGTAKLSGRWSSGFLHVSVWVDLVGCQVFRRGSVDVLVVCVCRVSLGGREECRGGCVESQD
jgi:hypothetical protein